MKWAGINALLLIDPINKCSQLLDGLAGVIVKASLFVVQEICKLSKKPALLQTPGS